MPRLIYADDFERRIMEESEICEDCAYTVVNLLDDAPTVDAVPVVHGKWVKATGMMPPEYFGKHVCSVCDHFAPNYFQGTHEWLSPICPCCGAKMDEKKDCK